MSFLNKEGLERLWQHIILKLGNKVDKVEGKGLSEQDYTAEEKIKLSLIENGANKTTVDSSLSTTSTNPVQNSVIASEINSIKTSFASHDHDDKYYTKVEIDTEIEDINRSIDEKINGDHNHDDIYYTQTQVDELLTDKSQVQIVTSNETESVTENIPTLKIYKLTQEQYDEKLANGTIDEDALYLTPDEEIDVDLDGYATIEQLNEKANAEHAHEIDDITNLQVALDTKVSTSRTINGKSLNEDIVISASDIGADVDGSASNALAEAKNYVDSAVSQVKNDLLNGAGEAYDTLKELGELIDENTDAISALETIANGKANASHNHDDLYYTETEIDNKISEINTAISDAKTYSNNCDVVVLESAQAYTDNALEQKSQVQIIIWEADD